jgi:hypothetical protein
MRARLATINFDMVNDKGEEIVWGNLTLPQKEKVIKSKITLASYFLLGIFILCLIGFVIFLKKRNQSLESNL